MTTNQGIDRIVAPELGGASAKDVRVAARDGVCARKNYAPRYLLNISGPSRPGSHARQSGGVGAASAIEFTPVY